MSKKFTQEQYQKIVELHDKRDFSVDGTLDVITYFVHNISRTGDADIDTALAIANPITREWAHDKFVEKEKKYYWTGKKEDNTGFVKRLYKDSDGMIVDHGIRKIDTDKDENNEDEEITETEIREWGYDPEMFEKEEV